LTASLLLENDIDDFEWALARKLTDDLDELSIYISTVALRQQVGGFPKKNSPDSGAAHKNL